MTSSKQVKGELQRTYFQRHAECRGLVERITEELVAMPLPEKATWGECGSLGYVAERLREVLRHLESGS